MRRTALGLIGATVWTAAAAMWSAPAAGQDPTMSAVRIHEFGGPEVLRVDEVPRPERGAREFLVACMRPG